MDSLLARHCVNTIEKFLSDMGIKDRIITRLNKGFGFHFENDDPFYHHGGRGFWQGSWSWGISHGSVDVGSMFSMTECLRWKRWVFDKNLNEIFEYVPSKLDAEYSDCIIEEL